MNRDLDIRVLGAGGQDQIRVLGETPNHPDLATSPFNFPAGHVAWGQPASGRVQVSLNQTAYNQIVQHARSGVHGLDRVEVGGILLGRVYRSSDDAAYHVTVEQALPDRLGISRAATFEFTHASWAALVAEAEEKHANLRIVGWYHSHPGYQAFFSPPDRHTQITYFSTPWRVGLVVDPVRDEGTFFVAAANSADAVELPGFYERLGQNDRSIITWRNWPKPRHAVEPSPSLLSPVQRIRPLPWGKIVTGIAVAWALLVSLLLLQMEGALREMETELRDLRGIVNQLTGQDAPAPATPREPATAPGRQRIPTPSQTPPSRFKAETPTASPAPTSTIKPTTTLIPSPMATLRPTSSAMDFAPTREARVPAPSR
jgi:proteasome lid subunit RPN8/RPN11